MNEQKESLEYLIIMLDEMRAEARKILHRYKYGEYDKKCPDMGFLESIGEDIYDQVEEIEKIFKSSMPPEDQKIINLKDENASLRSLVKALQDKLDFALQLKNEAS